MVQFYKPKKNVTKKRNVLVTFNKLDITGQGIGEYQGKTVFVPGVLPGEQAEVELVEEKRNYAKGRILTLSVLSPERIQPRCRHINSCGGCQQQHVPLAMQRQTKQNFLLRLFTKRFGLKMTPEPLLGGESYGYRRRARLGIQYHKKGQQLVIGFRQSHTNSLIDITECPVLEPKLEALIKPLRECLNTLTAKEALGHAELILADNTPAVLLRHMVPFNQQDRLTLLTFAEQQGIALFLMPEADTVIQETGFSLEYNVAGLHLGFQPQDFIQVNRGVNAKMVEQALIWLGLQPHDVVLDLFCGMGNFTLPIARRAQHVTGIEGLPSLIEKARQNALHNNVHNAEFLCTNLDDSDFDRHLTRYNYNKVLLDPARAGAEHAVKKLIQFAPECIVYVSCNPVTLVRDSEVLLSSGYQLDRIGMLDMFPHTGHLESMVLFTKNSQPHRR